ncbi:beta strand repeat-containing protein [Aquabacterium humicola]|uniref:beta strand repeat-containing protein n=1 Tax=Aquabacterium humicola TaxID=3237377 RepID=UPI0025432A37|nr:calcium-binding protein [Rubrivivax pictus]
MTARTTATLPAAVTTSALSAVGARFSKGLLDVTGDALDNNLAVSRNAAGQLLVNKGAIAISGGTPTVANTVLVMLTGDAGNDVLAIDESLGALPAAGMIGGAGNDSLTGGSGNDRLSGNEGNDVVNGKGGADLLSGGDGNDTIIGGDADDTMLGEGGDDRLIWNPGDDSDLVEGGDGIDTAEVNGGNGAERFTITTTGLRVHIDRVDPAPFKVDAGTIERIALNANGGDDVIDASGLQAASAVQLTVDGGAGNDSITGSQAADVMIGGDGNDILDGKRGNDTALMGAGDDRFTWNPGDGSDVLEGQAGLDTMVFNGAAGNEQMSFEANGGRVRFFRDIGNIVMDNDDVEVGVVAALGGTDTITVGDMTGTDQTLVRVDLAGTLGGTAGDGAADTVNVRGTQGKDTVSIAPQAGGGVQVSGLAATTVVTNADAGDVIRVLGEGGDDTLTSNESSGALPALALDGGAGNDAVTGGSGADQIDGGLGNDTLLGKGGADVMRGGDGNDILTGGDADDQMFGEGGNDRLIWNPGDDTDLVEGGDGTDTAEVNGGNGAERFTITTVGARVHIDRIDPAPFKVDAGTIESIALNTNGGDDVIDASGLQAASAVQLVVDGGAGNDSITGSQAADLFIGGDGNDSIDGKRGNDTALMGAGDDRFTWNPGDGSDVLEGQAGLDTMVFNGAAASEQMSFQANGGRVIFTRDIGNILMDNDDVEVGEIAALGGSDIITVNDLSGTDQTLVRIDLAATLGGTVGDGQFDRVNVVGTAGDDVATVSNDASGLHVDGLAASVVVTRFEDGTDRLTVSMLAGDDVIDASAATVDLVLEGGAGNDILIGGAGDDVLDGGDGDDVLLGGGGNDTFIGGEVTIQGFTAGAASSDKIDLRAFAKTFDAFDDVLAHARQRGGMVELDLGNGEQMNLLGVRMADLVADDFVFGQVTLVGTAAIDAHDAAFADGLF